jgi:hypothetical protein
LGFYSANFTLGRPLNSSIDVISVTVTSSFYNGSESTIGLPVNPYGPRDLTVGLDSIHPSTFSTTMNFVTLQAKVSAGGTPVSGVVVRFADSLSGLFVNSSATTDAFGVATATVYYVYQNAGIDMLTAEASMPGMVQGVGSNTLTIRPYGSDQLSVTEGVGSTEPVAGTVETVIGKVGWVDSSSSYAWSPKQNPVPNATVVVSDSLGLLRPVTVLTDAGGIFSCSFAMPSTQGRADVIQASASASGYKPSASSVFIVTVAPPVLSSTTGGRSSTVDTNSSSGVSSSSSMQSSHGAEAISPNTAAGQGIAGLGGVAILLALGVVAGALVLYRVARTGRTP